MSQPWPENLPLHYQISPFSISNPHVRTEAWLEEVEAADKGNKADVHFPDSLAAESADEAHTKLVLPGLLPCASGGVLEIKQPLIPEAEKVQRRQVSDDACDHVCHKSHPKSTRRLGEHPSKDRL